MKKLGLMLIVLLMMSFASCSVNPSKIGRSEANVFAEKITYVEDVRTNLCFGIVATRKTGDASSSGMGITEVPCNKVRNFLK